MTARIRAALARLALALKRLRPRKPTLGDKLKALHILAASHRSALDG